MGITRSRRAQIQREATTIRMRAQRAGHTTERIVTELRNALPELTALEAWRLALGWSRVQVVEQVAAAYFGEGLRPPGLSEARLCRMEHGQERPGPEYAEMLARAYGTSQETLGLMSRCVCGRDRRGYGQLGCWTPLLLPGVDMTSASGLPAVRESLRLALLDAPQGDPAVVELAKAAVEHYALNYSLHAPSHLFDEVHASRSMLAEALAAPGGDGIHRDLRRATGWLSGLLGNLAYHLADQSGARAHLALAASLGERVGDTRLVAWTLGAQSMLARARHDLPSALTYGQAGLERAPSPLVRAQLLGWAVLPSLARLGRAAEAERALGEATAALGASEEEPGRFGFDFAELTLHESEAWLALDRTDRAAIRAEASVAGCTPYTPGWAAATLVLAQAEAPTQPGDAAGRALDVLERVPADRLRSTSRDRLRTLVNAMSEADIAPVRDLRERARALPPHTDIGGRSTA